MIQHLWFRRTIHFFSHPALLPTIAFITILAFIWLWGPSLAIKHFFPLQSWITRLALSILAGIIFFAQLARRITPLLAKPVTATPPKPAHAENIQVLSKHFHAALQFVNKHYTQQKKTRQWRQLPLFLVIGTPQSGKTTLLQNEELGFLQTNALPLENNHQAIDPATNQAYCGWHVSDNALIFDVPGHYLFNTEMTDLPLWRHLVILLKKHRRNHPISGIVLTLDLPMLLTQKTDELAQHLAQLKQAIFLLSQQFKQKFSLYLLIAKMDRLAGFNEFFAELTPSVRKQPCGVYLEPEIAPTHLLTTFSQRFIALVKTLQRQLIWRLHQEHDSHNRQLIQDFPLQMESLKTILTQVVYQLTDNAGYTDKAKLAGVFFTGLPQAAPVLDPLSQHFTSAFSALAPLARPKRNGVLPLAVSKAYFSQDLFKQLLVATALSKRASQGKNLGLKKWLQHSHYIGLFLLSAGLLLIWGRDYQEKSALIYAAQRSINQYSSVTKNLTDLNDDTQIAQALANLTALQQAEAALNQAAHHSVFNFSATKIKQLATLTQQLYAQNAQTLLLEKTQSLIEQELINAKNTEPSQLYRTLQLYLMLRDKQQFNPSLLTAWLEEHQQLFIDTVPIANLTQHLTTLFNTPRSTVQLKDMLIKQARQQLLALPSAQLADIILNNSSTTTVFKPFATETKNWLFSPTLPAITLSSLYSANHFAEIYRTKIPQICQEALTGNWILGTAANQNALAQAQPQLIATVRERYLANYIQAWQQVLGNLQIRTFPNLHALAKATATSGPELTTITNIILVHLSPAVATFAPADRKQITTALQAAFPELLSPANATSAQKSALTPIAPSLTALRNYLQNIVGTQTSDKAAFIAASAEFTGKPSSTLAEFFALAKLAPEPVRSWLESLGQQAWQGVLVAARNYINQAWQAQVLPEYNSRLQGRYPFANGAAEINLADFSHFFAPNGTLEQFFNAYLAPFAETNLPKWQWRSLYKQTLPIALPTLLQLERGLVIQKMFFPTRKPLLKIPFTLEGVQLSPQATRFDLAYGDKIMLLLTPGNKTRHSVDLIWPVPNHPTINLIFADDSGLLVKRKEVGAWAWFKLLANSNLRTTADPTRFELTFSEGDFKANYRLIAHNVLNPFVPGVMAPFRCPENL